MQIEKYSFGIGDRFAKEGRALLEAIIQINKNGLAVVPVWNKSYREHKITGTSPASVVKEATDAVRDLNWKQNYYIDADHIGLENVEYFVEHSNFFTIDVANFISKPADEVSTTEFVKRHSKFIGKLFIPGIDFDFLVTKELLIKIANNYLRAIQEVAKIYNYLLNKKGKDNFIPEISMDECAQAQTPIDIFFILAELKYNNIDIQTLAPKFTGLFPKGVDYVGNINGFEKEFEQDVAVLKYAVNKFELPNNLKLSIHSGSDKFSIYPVIKKIISKFDAGIHVKTAGTTWLEEVAGLAEAGGEGLSIARNIYQQSLIRFDELTGPYSNVLDIDKLKLPEIDYVNKWDSLKYANTLIHDSNNQDYNRNFRQLIHVGYKIAAEMGNVYYSALDKYRNIIEAKVERNIYERHLKMLFL